MALLLPELRCKVMERPATAWTPNSVMLTLSSTTLTVVLAKIASDSGENTCHKILCLLKPINKKVLVEISLVHRVKKLNSKFKS